MQFRRSLSVLSLTAVFLVGSALVIPGVAQATPFCGIYWGSLDKPITPDVLPGGPFTNLRAGQHPCYDRLVFDVAGPSVLFHVGYLPPDAAGSAGPVRGGAVLRVNAGVSPYDDAGHLTFSVFGSTELVNVSGFRTFRQVTTVGTLGGITTLYLGVRARLPFRVFTLAGPGTGSRLVIDVAHRW